LISFYCSGNIFISHAYWSLEVKQLNVISQDCITLADAQSQGGLLFAAIFGAAWAVTIVEAIRRLQ
jgi:hypothetical protein